MFEYNKSTIGLIGAKGTGKTYLTKRILSHYPKHRILVLDKRQQYNEYAHVVPETLDVKTLDAFLKMVYEHEKDVCIVLDDLDLYLQYANSSPYLKNILVEGATKLNIGLIWQAKHLVNLDANILSETNFLIVGHTFFTSKSDLDKLTVLGFDFTMYDKYVKGHERRYVMLDTLHGKNMLISDIA